MYCMLSLTCIVHTACEIIIACISRGTFPAFVAIILLALECVMLLLTCPCLKAVAYFSGTLRAPRKLGTD